MNKLIGGPVLTTLVVVLGVGCGQQPRRLGDGSWYGKVVAVDTSRRVLSFAPACKLGRSGRWVAVRDRGRVALPLSSDAQLAIYFRPDGDPARGHGQVVEMIVFADVVRHQHLPNFPPGWFVTVRGPVAASVEEDSGIRSTGAADKREFACVWSRSTGAFVDN